MNKKLPMKKRWLIALDLDGTLLGNKKVDRKNPDFIPEKNIIAIKKLINLGHKVCLITGRPWRDTKHVYESLNLTTIVSNYNGSVIWNPTDKGFLKNVSTINRKLVNRYLSTICTKDMYTNIIVEFDEKTIVLDKTSKDFLEKFHITDNMIDFTTTKFDENPFSVVIELKKEVDHHELIKISKREFGNALDFRYWIKDGIYDLEINQKSIDKGGALEYISKYYNIPLSRVIAFGDGMNDIKMLSKSYYGVAMKNSKEIVKSHAFDSTDYSNDEGGVGEHLNNFFNLTD